VTVGLLCVSLGLTAPVFGQSFDLAGPAVIAGLGEANYNVDMTSADPVEGFVVAICVDPMLLAMTDIGPGPATTAAGAELVVPELVMGGGTLGVVVDAVAPFDGQTIPAPGGTIGTITVMPTMVVMAPTPTVLDFCDGVLNNPPLDNIIVVGGLSIGAGQGLMLNDLQIVIDPPPPDELTIEGGDIPSGGEGCTRILLNNSSGPVQGFVLAICNDPGLNLEDINIDGTVTDAVGAEFVVPNIVGANVGGTLGVVLDFQFPFDGQTIPVGPANHIANYCYSCVNEPVDPEPELCLPVFFCDGVLGSPPLDNVIVVAGLSLNPGQTNGEMCCQPAPLEDTKFFCGAQDEFGNIVDIEGGEGDIVSVCFFWCDPTDNLAGFQLAVCFDCGLNFIEGTFSVEGSILDEVGAEFVNHNVDNDPNDGDGCEFVAGILLDALPPFEGQTVPQTATPLLIGCIDAEIKGGTCGQNLLIEFCDGINGAGNVPINNIVVRGTESIQNFETNPCRVNVIPLPEFIRGDCNFDEKLDLADAATVLAQQFDDFLVPCEDACDANDDGKINLADSVFILNYLFKFGPEPPAPFPDPGLDPTDDELTCDVPGDCP
jgi:hypothetical protein